MTDAEFKLLNNIIFCRKHRCDWTFLRNEPLHSLLREDIVRFSRQISAPPLASHIKEGDLLANYSLTEKGEKMLKSETALRVLAR